MKSAGRTAYVGANPTAPTNLKIGSKDPIFKFVGTSTTKLEPILCMSLPLAQFLPLFGSELRVDVKVFL